MSDELDFSNQTLFSATVSEPGKVKVRYEQSFIEISFDVREQKDRFFLDTLTKLQREVEDLKRREQLLETYLPLEISDLDAKKMIVSYLRNLKEKGKTNVEILDITTDLKIPADQTERVFETLNKEGILK